MGSHVRRPLEDLIVDAAHGVAPVDGSLRPWERQWHSEEYRRSGQAALHGPAGPVAIVGEGLAAYEDCVARLLKEQAIKALWDPVELWGVVASLAVRVASIEDEAGLEAAATFASSGLRRLSEAPPSLVCLPLANVTWSSPPCVIGGGLLGRLDSDLVEAVALAAAGRKDLGSSGAERWITTQTLLEQPDSAPADNRELVVAVHWTVTQLARAHDETTRWLEDIVCLALLLSGDPADRRLYSGRSGVNRPGVRGVAQDRSTLEALLSADGRGRFEVASEPLVDSFNGVQHSVHWYSADPVALDELLLTPDIVELVGRSATGSSVLDRRLRVAARWYADAHWAEGSNDAALALGVALDALVGSRSGLPGRLVAQRFALLEAEPAQRRARQKRYNEVFKVRSAVAHGGESSQVSAEGFVRSVADDVRWAAERLIAFADRFGCETESDLEGAFEALALGESIW